MKLVPPWEIVRELVTRTDGETDPRYGCYPHARSMRDHMRYGVINLDKPPGPSSHEVVAWVRRVLGVQHAGHGGTLEG